MTIEEARQLTKYFGEGVRAHLWCHAGRGDWAITVEREEGTCSFYGIDELKRALPNHDSESPRIYRDEDSNMTFYSVDALRSCVSEMQLALDFIRQVSVKSRWKELPPALIDVLDWTPA